MGMHHSQSERNKISYTRSTVIDEQQTISSSKLLRPIKRVKHPTDRSLVVIFLKRLAKFLFAVFVSFPCVILITLMLPLSCFIRTSIRLICRYRCPVQPCTCSYLSSSDLFWLYNSNAFIDRNKTEEETKENCRVPTSIGAAVFLLDGFISEQSLKKLLVNRLVSNSFRRGSKAGRKLFPRFSQLIVPHASGMMWIDHLGFSIDEHVHEISRNIHTQEDLQSYVSMLISSELAFSRPLWQLYYKNRSPSGSGDSIIIFVYHPVLSDGISLLRILLKHVVDNRTTQVDIKPRFAGRSSDKIFNYIKSYLFGHMLLFSKLIFNSSRDKILEKKSRKKSKSHFNLLNQPQRLVIWSEPVSATQANRMKLVTRTRMNDLLSTLAISCMRLYMEKYGLSVSTKINCIMPCDLRTNTSNIVMGNDITHLSLELPLHIEGNIPLLWSFNEKIKRIKEDGDYATMHLFTHIIYLLFPVCIANKIMARIYDNASLWLTTIAAGNSTNLAELSICNRQIHSCICLNPSIGTHSINFCLTSYSDDIRFTVIVDPNAVVDPQFFTECFHQQFNIIQELLAHRRIPGEIRRIHRPPRFPPPKQSISSVSDASDDLTIEEIQVKMTTLQHELLSLKSQFEQIDVTDSRHENGRIIITTKLEELRKEFRELLLKLQERQCEISGMIPSDEEDEMDPDVRVRLRSASIASKISLKSNEQRQLSSKMHQFERDDGNEYCGIESNSASSSKMNFIGRRSNDHHQQQQRNTGMRRAQSVSICENTRVDIPHEISMTSSRPTTPSKLLTHTTIIHLDPSEQWKNGSGN